MKAVRREPEHALVADDDAAWRGTLARALARRGFRVSQAAGAAEAVSLAAADPPQLVVLDARMADSGLGALAPLRALPGRRCILLLSGYASVPMAVEAMRLGADDVLTKPADADQLLAAFARWRGAAPPPEAEPAQIAMPSLERVEWEYVQRVLAECDGNITEAARRLGLHRRSLQRKLRKNAPGG